jgi:hypothetical protein
MNSVVPTRQRKPWGLLVLVCDLPGSMAGAAGTREQSLDVRGVWGPDLPQGLQGSQFCDSAACFGEQSLCAVGVLGPNFPHGLQGAQSHGTAASSRE